MSGLGSHSTARVPLPTLSNLAMPPRRSSYASVAAGTANPNAQYQPPARSGAFSHLSGSSETAYSSLLSSNLRAHRSQHSPERSYTDDTSMAGSSWGRSRSPYGSGFSGKIPIGGRHGHFSRYDPDHQAFLRPSYLRESKYMERLEQAHKAKIAARREAASTRSSNQSSLSKSSSTISLKRLEPSHRGMTYEIKESRPPVEDEVLPALPSRWAETDQMGGLKIEPNGLDIRFSNDIKLHDHEAVAARSDHPMPPQCGIYYYEVTIISKGKDP